MKGTLGHQACRPSQSLLEKLGWQTGGELINMETVTMVYRSIVVVAVYFILSRLLYLAHSANLGLLCMPPHPGMGPLA